MELRDMTKTQLYRLFFRIKPSGSWDWRTLRITYPVKWLALRSIAWQYDRKEGKS